jgi:hypothetical protein
VRYSAIPEPGTLTLAAIASLGAGWYQRRRKKQPSSEDGTGLLM